MDVHIRIRAWREKLRLTRKIFAQLVDVSVSLVSYWESGGCIPPVPMLQRICEKAFGISLERFFGYIPKARKSAKVSARAQAAA